MGLKLITGAPGWLGIRMVRILHEGSPDIPSYTQPEPGLKLRCLVQPGIDDAPLRKISPQIEIVRGDLTQREGVASFCKEAAGATLFHIAGIIHPRRVPEFYALNADGTRHALEAAEAAGVRRAVVISSNSPFGNNPHRDHVFTEESPYNPFKNYGRSKKMLEDICKEVHARGKLEVVIIRPPWYYGPDQPARQTLFFEMIKAGKAPIVGSGENRRSMVYIDNLCKGLILAEQTPKAAGEDYWIADARPYTMNEIVDTVEKVMERDFKMQVAHKRMKLPGIASEIAVMVDGMLQAVGMYHQKIHVLGEMNKTIACSIDKARRDLGYEPKFALEEGMRRSIAWCLENGIKL